MDWRDIVGGNKDDWWKRQNSNVSTTTTNPTTQSSGFFGNLNPIEKAGDVVAGIGGFFGGMVTSVIDSAKTAVGGIKDVVEGSVKASDLGGITSQLDALNKERSNYAASLTDVDYDDPTIKAKLEEYQKKAQELVDQGQGIVKSKDWKESQGVDAVKTAAASADTFLNVAGVAGLLKAVGKGVITQGAKVVGKTVVQKTAEETAKATAKATAAATLNRTGTGALKNIGKNAAEGALLGGAYGAYGALEQGGVDTSAADIAQSALLGGTVGGVLGGAGSLLDKNVRAGLRQLPNDIKTGTLKTASQNAKVTALPAKSLTSYEGAPDRARVDYYKNKIANGEPIDPIIAMKDSTGALGVEDGKHRLQAYIESGIDDVPVKVVTPGDVRKVTQGGYLRVPGAEDSGLSRASGAADDAQRQLMGEDIQRADPIASNYINSEVARYSTPDQYIDDLTESLWQNNKKGKGVETMLQRADPESYDVTSRITTSNNSKFYSDYYKAHGTKPTKQGIRDIVEQELTGQPSKTGIHTNILDSSQYSDAPFARDIYQQLVDRDTGFQRTIQQGPPADMFTQYAGDLGLPSGTTAPKVAGTPTIPKTTTNATSATNALFNTQDDVQRALGRMESETNPNIDYVDTSVLPSGARQPGVQQNLQTQNINPYEGMPQDFSRLALPAGEKVTVTPSVAKTQFKKTGVAPEFQEKIKPSSKPIELAAKTSDVENLGLRQTKGGKLKPFKQVTKDELKAIKQIADDDTSSAFTTTRTPSMNLSEAFKKQGGEKSKGFRILDKYNTTLREHNASYTTEVQNRRDFLERFIQEYGIDGKSSESMRDFLQAATKEESEEAMKAYVAQYGLKAGEGMQRLRTWWRAENKLVRDETNNVIKQFAGEDHMMGDLGETYLPRVYVRGKKGFKEAVLDVAHAGMDKIGGKKGMFNLESGSGYLDKLTENAGGILRNSEGIPLNSEFTKPNTTFLSAAQKRTARTPQEKMEDPITSMMRYFDATARAKHLTPDISKGQELKRAIELINNDSNNLRQMYKSFDDQVNSIAGKTSRLDRPFVDSKRGAEFVDIASKIQSRISKSTVTGSVSSAMAQTGQLPLVFAENGAGNFAGGVKDIMRFARAADDVADPMVQSALMKSRYPKYQDLFKVSKAGRAGNKATEVISKPFRVIEHASSELAWRSSYRRSLADGFSGKEAIQEADRITAKLIGERSPGARAALYESRAASPITAYTLEVNQMYQMAKQYFKNDPKRAAKLVGAIWLYNNAYETMTGNRLNADPIDAATDMAKILSSDDYDSEGNQVGFGEKMLRATGRGLGEAIDATPLGGVVAGSLYPEQGFRVPFGGGERTMSASQIFGDTSIGRYGGGTPIASGISNPLLLLGIPGMSQLQKSVEGVNAYNAGGSMSPSGRLRFSIPQTPEEYWRSLLLGQYGTGAGRDYIRSQTSNLAGQ